MNRRTLLKGSLLATSLVFARPNWVDAWSKMRQEKPLFQMDLSGSDIGIESKQEELIQLAQKHGFAAVEPLVGEIVALPPEQQKELPAKLTAAKLVWSAANLPVDFDLDEEKFNEVLKTLPVLCQSLQAAGVTRLITRIQPASDTLTYRANFRQLSLRLKEAAKILEAHAIRLGLEYDGTKSSWTEFRFPFVHTIRETDELITVIGQNNVGFVLDSWSWAMAGESVDQIKALGNPKIVLCELSDAPAGIELPNQIGSQRELPMATGVIDTKAFLQALVDIKYDGPIRAQPANQTLNELDPEPAALATAEAMKKAFATVGG